MATRRVYGSEGDASYNRKQSPLLMLGTRKSAGSVSTPLRDDVYLAISRILGMVPKDVEDLFTRAFAGTSPSLQGGVPPITRLRGTVGPNKSGMWPIVEGMEGPAQARARMALLSGLLGGMLKNKAGVPRTHPPESIPSEYQRPGPPSGTPGGEPAVAAGIQKRRQHEAELTEAEKRLQARRRAKPRGPERIGDIPALQRAAHAAKLAAIAKAVFQKWL